MTDVVNETYLEKFKGAVKYAQPTSAEVDINVPNIKGNRIPEGWMKYLIQGKGFDWSMWRKPYVIEVPVAEGRRWVDSLPKHRQAEFEKGFVSIEGYGMVFRVMFDGGHRRAIYKYVFPNATTFLCDIYKVKTVEEAHLQFVKIQFELQKRLHKDILFIQSVYGGDEKTVLPLRNLETVGLTVVGDDSEDVVPQKFVKDISKPSISRNGFEKICKFEIDSIKLAVDLVKDALGFNKGLTYRPKLNQYLLYAVVDVVAELKASRLSETDIATLIKVTLNDWVSIWDDTGAKAQMEYLEAQHTSFWNGATMSPTTAGIAFQDLVYKQLGKLQTKGLFPGVSIDPAHRQAEIVKEAANRRYARMQAKLKKAVA